MHILPFCAVFVFVPENKLVELSLKSPKDLCSILRSLQLSGIFILKNSKWPDTILVIFYSLLSYFFLFYIFFVETVHRSVPPCLQRGRDRINLEILAFVFQTLEGFRICDPKKSDLNKCGRWRIPQDKKSSPRPRAIEKEIWCLMLCFLAVVPERQ